MMNETFAETGESIFSTVTRLAREYDAINLGQGFPNFQPPAGLRERLSAREESHFSEHQYAPSPGVMALRRQVASFYRRHHGLNYDPELEITVTTGATEALAASLYGLLNEGDEVVVFDPVYDLYAPVARRAGASVTAIPLTESGFELPVNRLKREVDEETDLLIVNNPHNPTGRVFTEAELQEIVHVARAHDMTILSDEVYEQLTFESAEHIPLASFEGARERTLSIGSVGKLFNATGWKIGWVMGSEELTRSVRASHQFTTFATATPLQVSVAEYMEDGEVDEFLRRNREQYDERRGILLDGLAESPFEVVEPSGTYFAVARVPDAMLSDERNPDMALVKKMVRDHGLAAIPLSSFYVGPEPENHYLRFAFCKKKEELEEATRRLARI